MASQNVSRDGEKKSTSRNERRKKVKAHRVPKYNVTCIGADLVPPTTLLVDEPVEHLGCVVVRLREKVAKSQRRSLKIEKDANEMNEHRRWSSRRPSGDQTSRRPRCRAPCFPARPSILRHRDRWARGSRFLEARRQSSVTWDSSKKCLE